MTATALPPGDIDARMPRHLLSQQSALAGKLRRLALFPAHSITARLGVGRWLHSQRTARAELILGERGHRRLLAGGDPDALPQDAADLVFLYDTIVAKRPHRAIEFGSGQSTVMIAQALHDSGRGHLWSLDADERWLENTRAVLPPHLRPFVTFVHSPAMLVRTYGVPAWRYSIMPEGAWDFVLVDGPPTSPEVPLSIDLIELAPRLRKGAVGMIDHRWRTAALAKEIVGRELAFRYVPSLESFVFEKRHASPA